MSKSKHERIMNLQCRYKFEKRGRSMLGQSGKLNHVNPENHGHEIIAFTYESDNWLLAPNKVH